MGNQACCQVAVNNQKFQEFNKKNILEQEFLNEQEQYLKDQQNIILPELSQKIKQTIQKLKKQPILKTQYKTENTQNINKQNSLLLLLLEEFQEQKNQGNIIKVRFGGDVYHGELDTIGRPTKIGKMYKENHALFIGSFVSGKAEGKCIYLMKDGSYYQGMMRENIAECEKGKFVNAEFEYEGGFMNNKFHGNGKELIAKDHYFFEGIYKQGKKFEGTMQWVDLSTQQQYKYQGKFDQNGLFCNKAILSDANGRYQGQFSNGMKYGYGVYYYYTKLRYEGYYVNDQKQGEGKLFNSDNSLAYKGIFKNGLPNGKGMATTKGGVEFQTEWRDGIDVRLLQ